VTDFQNVDRDTPYLMPPVLQDWLPENHLARFVVDVVASLDLGPLYDSYSGRGSDAVDPGMLLSLLFYCYATGTFSSRKIEKATYESIPVRFICGNRHPDHDTIADFRKRILPRMSEYFTAILVIAGELGFTVVGKVSVDGSKFRANASKHKAMSYDRAVELEARIEVEVKELLMMAELQDRDEQADLDIPKELEIREQRLNNIRRAKQVIEERAAERDRLNRAEYEQAVKERAARETKTGKKPGGKPPAPPVEGPRAGDQYNFTDPESRIMKEGSTGGFGQCYNAQLSVDQETMLIIGNTVSDQPNDKQQLVPALDAIPAGIGKPKACAADAGYFSEQNIAACAESGIEIFLATGREPHYRTLADLTARPLTMGGLSEIELDGISAKEFMQMKTKTVEGREIFGRRKSTVEPVYGIIKQALGFRQFLLRGLQNVTGEWTLVATGFNLKRMFNLKCRGAPLRPAFAL